MSTAQSFRGGWTALVISTAGRCALAMFGGLVLWSILPAAIGWRTTVVMTGSMQPKLPPGDVVIARPTAPGAVRLGQISPSKSGSKPQQPEAAN
jgi:signal peptidase